MFPEKKEPWALAKWNKFMRDHMHRDWHARVKGKSARAIVGMQAMFDVPARITHRIKEDRSSIIHRKEFNSGRVSE